MALRAAVPVIRLHDLHHTHATLRIDAGAPTQVVSERLGHARASFTIDAYQHVHPPMQAEAGSDSSTNTATPPEHGTRSPPRPHKTRHANFDAATHHHTAPTRGKRRSRRVLDTYTAEEMPVLLHRARKDHEVDLPVVVNGDDAHNRLSGAGHLGREGSKSGPCRPARMCTIR